MREMRAMCFGEAEALKALIARAQKSREKLPQGQVKLDLMPDDPPIIRLIFTDDYGRREIIERDPADVAAALVGHCIERRIRLPANASKFVDIIDGKVALLIYMDERDAVRQLMRRPRVRPARKTAGDS
jgi:hypothetical protein